MNQFIIPDFPKVRGSRNQNILNTINSFLVKDGRISKDSLEKIKEILRGNDKHLPLNTLRRLAHTLTLLKDSYCIDTVIPPIPIPPPRSSILPETAEEFSWMDGVFLLNNLFWEQWIGKKSTKNERYENLIFSFAFSLATDASLYSEQIADTLTKLRWGDIVNQGTSLKVKVHPDDRLNRYCMINLPTPTRLITYSLFKFTKPGKTEQPFLFSNSELKPNRKKTKINNIIKTQYLKLIEVIRERSPSVSFPPSWPEFTQVSHLTQFDKGLEPFIISALRQYPLPVSHPVESSLNIYGNRLSHQASPFFFSPVQSEASKKTALKSVEASNVQKSAKPTDDWCGKSKTVLSQLVKKLKDITKKKIHTNKQVQRARDLISDSIHEADHLAPGKKSALHLALHWIRDFITENRSVSPSTVGDYFSTAFNTGFLMFGDSDDLMSWDIEDHDQAIESSLSREKCSPTYKKKIIDRLRIVYRYAEKHGYSDHVNINFIADEWIGSSTRIEVIGLHRFDSFIKQMMEAGDHESQIIGIASILAFYGGLRAGETTALTLKNVIAIDGHVYIEICSGKTPAARRRVPLHLFASEYMCNIIKEHWEKRFAEFKKKGFSKQQPNLNHIPFFGPEKSREAYTRKTLIDATIVELKRQFGADIVYHSLRHSFASWMLIRWYAGRYPDFIQYLEEKNHEIFGTQCQTRLNSFFTPEPGRIPDYNASDLVKFSKAMGHNGHETLFSTYFHAFDAVQYHAMLRVSHMKGKVELSGKTISAVVPKMKDRHNHTKLPGRSINEICDYLGIGVH